MVTLAEGAASKWGTSAAAGILLDDDGSVSSPTLRGESSCGLAEGVQPNQTGSA